MDYLIGLDIGTSSVKGVLMSINGSIERSCNRQLNYIFDNGFKVLDPDGFCDICFEVIRELVPENGRVIALCPSGASGDLLFVKDGKSCSYIYGWQNEVDEKTVRKYFKPSASEVYNTVGWHKINSFPPAVMAYIKENNPKLIADSDKICMHIEYLNYMLTGKWGITASMGTPFYMINQNEGIYHKEYLDMFGIDEQKLPQIMDNCSVLGEVTENAAKKTGLFKDTPVVLGTFDHPSAARGAGVFNENEVMLSCGTSWVIFMPFTCRQKPLDKNMLVDRFMYPKGNWCGMLSLTSIAEKIEKYKKEYLGSLTYEQFDKLAEGAPFGANGLVIDSCENNVDKYSKSDIARAIMESIARELDSFLKDAGVSAKEIKIVGGITNSKIWLKVISEVTNKKITVINGECAGAAGSAIMAGVGAGVFESEQAFWRKMEGK